MLHITCKKNVSKYSLTIFVVKLEHWFKIVYSNSDISVEANCPHLVQQSIMTNSMIASIEILVKQFIKVDFKVVVKKKKPSLQILNHFLITSDPDQSFS